MPKPKKHVFVCAQARAAGHPRGSCAEKGCAEVFNAFLAQFQQRNLWNDYQVTSTGCLGPCQAGPSVLVYPEGVMYASVKPGDVTALINEHLIGDTPVERLLAPAPLWG